MIGTMLSPCRTGGREFIPWGRGEAGAVGGVLRALARLSGSVPERESRADSTSLGAGAVYVAAVYVAAACSVTESVARLGVEGEGGSNPDRLGRGQGPFNWGGGFLTVPAVNAACSDPPPKSRREKPNPKPYDAPPLL